jgi:hypothetical protein
VLTVKQQHLGREGLAWPAVIIWGAHVSYNRCGSVPRPCSGGLVVEVGWWVSGR